MNASGDAPHSAEAKRKRVLVGGLLFGGAGCLGVVLALVLVAYHGSRASRRARAVYETEVRSLAVEFLTRVGAGEPEIALEMLAPEGAARQASSESIARLGDIGAKAGAFRSIELTGAKVGTAPIREAAVRADESYAFRAEFDRAQAAVVLEFAVVDGRRVIRDFSIAIEPVETLDPPHVFLAPFAPH
jgi:hypothetical protein